MSDALHPLSAQPLRRFKRYPAYKDSGVEWLGTIPTHWEVKRLKYVAPARMSKLQSKPSDAAYVGLEHIEPWTGQLLLENQPETVDSVVASFKAGDILFGKLRPYLAKVARPEFDGVCTSEILPLSPVCGCSQRYLAYALLNAPYIHWLDSLTYGTKMPRVSPEQVAVSFVTLPPAPEQRAIAAFLDRETARIDALVAKKERLIELLQEKRTALITRAVTKGLDPTVPMKDSGVEWLGEIPAHWEVKKVKRLCVVRRGASPRPIDDPIYFDDDGEYAWVRIADVTASERYLETTTQRLSDLGRSKSVALEPGELFVSIAATVGKPIITKIKCCIHDGFVYFVGLRENREYLYYLFSCGEPYKGLGKLGTQLNLNTDTIGDIYLPRPSGEEQQEIVQFLDTETAKIDVLIAKIREAIKHLKELRTALISAAVTGKIDVREEIA
jgi:Restriction endonuclease S subunits